MPKRQALNPLTQENWDDPEEEEVPGTFGKLSEEELSNRVIKQARRRCVNLGNTMQSSSPFASFKGFGSKVEPSTSENGDVNSSQHGNGNILAKETLVSKPESSTAHPKNDTCRDLEYYRLLKCLNESLVNWVTQHLSKNPLCDFSPVFSDYKRHLEGLEARFPAQEEGNTISVDKLKKENSTNNSLSQPPKLFVFSGYKRHLEGLEARFPAREEGNTISVDKLKKENSTNNSLSQPPKLFESSVPAANSTTSGLSSKPDNNSSMSSAATIFGSASSKECSSKPNMIGASPLFNVSKSVVAASNTAVAATGFQLGNITNCSSSKQSTSTSSTAEDRKETTNIFTIPITSTVEAKPSIPPAAEIKPFSFASSAVKNNEKEDTAEGNEESEEPPKNEFTPVVEKDAVYSKRCKLFYNKEGNYVEKGVGTLYLKPFKGKTQLLIRADTSLGNILLNIFLASSLLVKRVGKNNVLVVCIPNPPVDLTKENSKEAVHMLIRVKTEDDANELLKQIEESKSS